jgi:hypothetical protein
MAIDDTKPVAECGVAFTDPVGDNNVAGGTNPTLSPAKGTDATALFLKHDPAKGDQATTLNLIVKDLSPEVPPGYTTVSWTTYYPGPDGMEHWVRAVADFGGGVSFEAGHIEAPEANGGVSVYDSETPGKLFEGADGVVQLVVPKDDAKPGSTLKPIYTVVGQGQASVPAGSGAPVRGLTWRMDNAPEDGAEGAKSATVAECQPGATPTPGPTGPDGTPTTPPPGGQPTTTPPTGSRALPVKLVTKSVKGKKVKKRLKLKLRSTERVTNVAAQLRKGNKVVGRGKLAALSGKGAIKLKVKKLRKGKYVLDLAGNDASGKRLLAALKLRVK